MLRVSTRGEYGVRLMVHLARHYGDRPCSLTEISLAEGLELQQQYLEQLVRSLRQHGMWNPPVARTVAIGWRSHPKSCA